jgi:hypothetical protein
MEMRNFLVTPGERVVLLCRGYRCIGKGVPGKGIGGGRHFEQLDNHASARRT